MKFRIAFLIGAALSTALVVLRIMAIAGTGRPLPVPALPLLSIAALAGGCCGLVYCALRGWREAGGRKTILAYWLMGCTLFLPLAIAAMPYSEIFGASDAPSVLEFVGVFAATVVGFGGLVGIGIRLYTINLEG